MHTMRPDTCPDAAVVKVTLAILRWCARLQGRASSGKGPAEAAAVDQVITSPGGHTACSTNGVIPLHAFICFPCMLRTFRLR